MKSSLHAVLLTLSLIAGFWPAVSMAQKYHGVENWRYVPSDADFWKDFSARLDGGDLSSASKVSVQQEASAKNSLEKNEAKIAQILVLEKAGMKAQAYRRSLEVLEGSAGSMQGLMALSLADRLARDNGFELQEARRIVNIGAFTDVPDKTMPFVSYLVTLDNLGRGYVEWAARSEAFLKDDSYWGALYHTQQLLGQVGTSPDEVGLLRLQSMRDKVGAYPRLKKMIEVQIARVSHRLRMYQASDRLYGAMDLGGRDYGRLLYERSWVRYGLQDYSVSLGLLESLKAPFFAVAADPEQYILAMIEFRDLCHYPAVRKLTKEFGDVFGPTLKFIKSAQPLERSAMLIRMVAQKMPYQSAADEIAMLKSEVRALEKNELALGRDFVDGAISKAERLEKILAGRFERSAEDELKAEAERLVTLNEQVKLIEYVSDLDEYRLSQMFEMRAYESEKAEKHATEGLFWPFLGEYWKDEMSNYRVLISDRCRAGKKESR